MTEVEQYTEPNPTVVNHQSVALSSIHQTATELQDAHQIATAICRTAFVPEHFRGKPEETAVGILYGATVGFDPLTAVQQIFVIGGKPALYARAMVAIVMKAGHEIWTEEEKPGLVTVAGRRAGSDHVSRVTWTTELAKQAGYDKNSKYRSDPRSMLYARASGDVARRIAPDALLGLAYNVEEMQLVGTANVVVPAVSSAKDQVRAAIGGTPETSGSDDKTAEEWSSSEPSSVAAPSEPGADVEPISDRQMKMLHKLFSDAKITDRDVRLEYSSKVIGHVLASSSDLAKTEAHDIIEALLVDIEVAETTDTTPADPDLDALRDEILVLAETKGRTLWDVETAFSDQHEGLRFYDGSEAELQAFHAWVKKQKKAA